MSTAWLIRAAKGGKPYKKKRFPAVSDQQKCVLAELEDTGALTVQQLSGILGVPSNGDIERRLQGLLKRGYVQWQRPEEDSTLQYYISTSGKTLLREDA